MPLTRVGRAWVDLNEIAIATVENGKPVVYLRTSGARVVLLDAGAIEEIGKAADQPRRRGDVEDL